MAIGTQCVMLTSTVKGLFGKQGLKKKKSLSHRMFIH